MMKRVLCLLAALCLLAVLGGCARQGGEEQAPVPTLAPAVVDYEAPDGDRIVGMSGDRTYYVPERGQPKLGVRSVHLEGTNLKDTVEALIRRASAPSIVLPPPCSWSMTSIIVWQWRSRPPSAAWMRSAG